MFKTFLAAALLTLFSCANNSSDSSSDFPSIPEFDDSTLQEGAIAVYSGTINESQSGYSLAGITKIYFFEDNTFLIHMAASTIIAADSFTVKTIQNYDFAKGTYDGDPTKDGKLEACITKQIDKKAVEEAAAKKTSEMLLKNLNASSITVSLTNEELPLKETGYSEDEEITISGGKMYIPEEPHPYIRTK